ncbi:MAG: DUF2206 domain-containing protein [Methanomicrobiaceae archaeon]|uniref:DUF2206 domain-containing protein n=1 Tax=hydrocarbon metagenome TaxID=938273 RepID=A0A0W8FFV7_9ZZZZ|nr:DUF2206 domain-containing protein [Methanomicrobiaceae archaeon]
MQIRNPVTLNDWDIGRLFIVVLGFQLGVPIFSLLHTRGFMIPVLLPALGFVYLSFIPGILMLRIFRIHRRSTPQTLLYAAGLSIGSMMFLGSAMNFLYPFAGIADPLSAPSLLITLNAVIWLLFIVGYVRDGKYADPEFIEIRDLASKPAALLYIIPILTVAGAYLVNGYQENLLLMFIIALIAVVATLIAFGRLVPRSLYPLAVLSISVSLLLHTSLISPYIWGYDIHLEYYLANLVLSQSYWNHTLPGNVNAMLSIVILAPMLTEISAVSLTAVFKVMYPLLFALVPLALYQAFKSMTSETVAFLGTFVFVSYFSFYTEMAALPRQAIAEIFLVLVILLMLDRELTRRAGFALYVIFGASMVVSHYGLTYIYMFILIAVWVMLALAGSTRVHRFAERAAARFRHAAAGAPGFIRRLNAGEKTVTVWHIIFFVLFANLWYANIAGGTSFETIVAILHNIGSNLFTEFLNPESVEGLDILLSTPSTPLHEIAKYLHLITLVFIVAGFIGLVFDPRYEKIRGEFFAFALVALLLAIAGIAVPYVASSLNTSRLYQITLIFLSLFCAVGGLAIFRAATPAFLKPAAGDLPTTGTKAVAVILAAVLLFNSGWVYECARDNPLSIALSQESIMNHQDEVGKNLFYGLYVPEYDVRSAAWLSATRDPDLMIYADRTRKDNVLNSYGSIDRQPPLLTNSSLWVAPGAYVYLGCFNVVENCGTGPELYSDIWSMDDIRPEIASMGKIYSNARSEIYKNR